MTIFGEKSDIPVVVQVAMKGMLPLLAQVVRESPKVKGIVVRIAKAEQRAIDAHKMAVEEHQKLLENYKDLREEIGDLLSANGLEFMLDDYAAVQADQVVPAPEVKPDADGAAPVG